jgi:hypothetical protein
MRRSMRLIAVLLVAGAVGFGASAAFGTTGSSTAGSLSFSVTSPDTVTKGQPFQWSFSVTNNSPSVNSDAMLSFTIAGPSGNRTYNYAVKIPAGATIGRSATQIVPNRIASGAYTLTLHVNSPQNGSGQASASSTVS